jgi:hypothetical protein
MIETIYVSHSTHSNKLRPPSDGRIFMGKIEYFIPYRIKGLFRSKIFVF